MEKSRWPRNSSEILQTVWVIGIILAKSATFPTEFPSELIKKSAVICYFPTGAFDNVSFIDKYQIFLFAKADDLGILPVFLLEFSWNSSGIRIWILWDLNLSNIPLCTMSRHASRLHNLDLFLGYESSFFPQRILLGMVRLREVEDFRLNEFKMHSS